jgi:tetratricopeptide (TPR) repeat protein
VNPEAAPAPSPSGPPAWALALGAAVLAFAVFAPSLAGVFLNWDDEVNFVHNDAYRGLGPGNLEWMFTDFTGHYMPVTWLTLGLDYALWGMAPRGYHLTNLLFHAAVSAAFYFVVLAILRKAQPRASERLLRWSALAGALFFAVHPLRAESVAWITERRDLVSGLFFMLSLLAYLRLQERPDARRKWLLLSLACFLLSILSKAMGMTLPFVLLALDAWPLRRFETRAGVRPRFGPILREKLPYVAIMIAAVALTYAGQRQAAALLNARQYPPIDMLLQPPYRLCFYVWKTAVPAALSPLYPFRSITLSGLEPRYVVGIVAGLAALALLWRFRRRRPELAVAAGAYLALIAPVAGVLQAGPHFAADRYTYLACLPFAVLFGGWAAALAPRSRMGVACGTAALLSALAVLGWRQSHVWLDSLALWDHAIRVGTSSPFPYVSRATARADRGDLDGAVADFDAAAKLDAKEPRIYDNLSKVHWIRGDLDAAVASASRAIELDPTMANPYQNRAIARLDKGDAAGAIEDLSKALSLDPRLREAHLNRAFARQRAGDLHGAIDDASRAVALNPADAKAHAARGRFRAAQRDLEGALADLARAKQLDPRYAAPHVARGSARANSGDHRGAIEDYDEAVRRDARDATAYFYRGLSRKSLGDVDGAISDLDASIRIHPRDADVWANRAALKAGKRDLAGAIADSTEAIRLDPRNPEAYGNRAGARADQGDLPGAVEDFETSLRLARPDWPHRATVQAVLDRVKRKLGR